MKYLSVLCVSLALLPALSHAQTKKIAWKSHSGSPALFAAALENEVFDMSFSNFGMAPVKIVKNAQLDSVIFISEHKAIMVTSEYCHDKYTSAPDHTLWKAGRDTVTDHPLFSKQHCLDSIREVIKQQYYFRNKSGNTKFIGYDNKKTKKKPTVSDPPPPPSSSSSQQNDEGMFLPSTGSDNNHPPSGGHLLFYVGILSIAALFGGLFSWQYRQS